MTTWPNKTGYILLFDKLLVLYNAIHLTGTIVQHFTPFCKKCQFYNTRNTISWHLPFSLLQCMWPRQQILVPPEAPRALVGTDDVQPWWGVYDAQLGIQFVDTSLGLEPQVDLMGWLCYLIVVLNLAFLFFLLPWNHLSRRMLNYILLHLLSL